MTIFSRFRDIIGSNINAMLDKAEDPEKLIRLMIREMEDTLVEIKSSCASTMAQRARTSRNLDLAQERATDWSDKAELALDKGREDLAREALVEKKHYDHEADKFQRESDELTNLVSQYQEEIRQLEEKLESARQKHRVLVERAHAAKRRMRSQKQIREAESTDAFARFEKIENKIERMESEADLVNYGRKPNLEEEFSKLEGDTEVEAELEALRQRVANRKAKGDE